MKKKTLKLTKGSLVSIIVVGVIAGIILLTLYLGFPKQWQEFVNLVNKIENTLPTNSPPSNNLIHSDGELFVDFVDVGQGDCMIAIMPDGKTMMVDGGDEDSEYKNKVINELNELGINKLDWVILTHTDADHCGSLNDAIDSIAEVENIYIPKIKTKRDSLGLSNNYCLKDTNVYADFVDSAQNATYKENGVDKPANIHFLEDTIKICDNETQPTYLLTMYCRDDAYYRSVSPNNSHEINDVSPISVLEFNGKKFILTGDANKSSITSSSEKYFLETMQSLGYTDATFDADVLKVPHHGGKDSSGADFLNFIDCEYAVVSVGDDSGSHSSGVYDLYISQQLDNENADIQGFAGNGKYDHPHRNVVGDGQRLESSGILKCYYTLLNGDILFRIDSDGELTVSADKDAFNNNGDVVYYTNDGSTASLELSTTSNYCLIDKKLVA